MKLTNYHISKGDCADKPIFYGKETDRFRVMSWKTNWYVADMERMSARKIGPYNWRGINYFDRAVEICKEKNKVN